MIHEYSNYISKLDSGKYFLNSGSPEFGYELIATLPYAYHLSNQELIEKTTSSIDTACFYFFSPEHIENNIKRSWSNIVELQKEGFPNIYIHNNNLDWSVFSPPPLREFYQDKAITYSKPTVVISNRKNNEWSGVPVNYFSSSVIEQLFAMLSNSYQIVYIDSEYFGIDYEDHMPFQSNNISNVIISKYSVITLRDLKLQYPDLSFNEIQCRIYAGCERFISSNGGLGILASYFGGENIIFSKMCHELNADVNSFYHWYPKLSKAIVKVVNNENQLLETVRAKWIDNKPLINVIIRTADRPNYFHDCIVSVLDQTYTNFNIIVAVANEKSREYVVGHNCTIVEMYEDVYDEEYLFSLASTGYILELNDTDRLELGALDRLAKDVIADKISTQRISSDIITNYTIQGGIAESDKASVTIKQRPPLVILLTVEEGNNDLERCLDNIFLSSQSFDMDIKVIVGVYGLAKLREQSKKILLKFDGAVDFYNLPNINHKYLLKNAVLKKIKRRDSLVFCADDGDIITTDTLRYYYDYACGLIADGFQGVLKTNTLIVPATNILVDTNDNLDISELTKLIHSNDYEKVIANLVGRLQKHKLDDFYIDYLKQIAEYQILTNLANQDNYFRYKSSCESYICSYQTFEKLGFFNKHIFAQDTDLLNRSKLLFEHEYYDHNAPYIIRNFTHSKVSNSIRVNLYMDWQKSLQANDDNIKSKNLVAEHQAVKINKLL